MEKEFTEWFETNEKRFSHGQFDEKQIAYSAWLEGRKQALTIPAVINSVCDCGHPHHQTDKNGREYCRYCEKDWNEQNDL